MKSVFGEFRIEAELGRGANAAVHRATHIESGRVVALKVLAPELVRDLDARERFEREADAARAVDHPNVVRLEGAGVTEGAPWLAFELVPGGALAPGRLPWTEVASIGAQVARGLEAIHARGLVHRDVKPANLLVTDSGAVKLADLGLARFQGSNLTRTGEVLGTLEYLSPEQANAARDVGPAADLYGLGATLHALLVGAPPFAGAGLELVRRHLSERPRSVGETRSDVPEAFERLILRLLEKSPSARGTASSVAAELEAIAGEGPVERASRTRLALAGLGVVLAMTTLAVSYVATRPAPSPSPSARLPSPTGTSPSPEPRLRVLEGTDAAEVLQPCLASGQRKIRITDALGTYAWKFPGPVHGIAFSPDSKHAIVLGVNVVPLLFDVVTGRFERRVGERPIVPHAMSCARGEPFRVAVVTDGGELIVFDGAKQLWQSFTDDHWRQCEAVAFERGGRRLFTCTRAGEIASWNLETGACDGPPVLVPGVPRPPEKSVTSPVNTIDVEPGARAVALGLREGQILRYDLGSKETATLEGIPGGAGVAMIAALERWTIGLSTFGNVHVWEPTTARHVGSDMLRSPASHLVASPDGAAVWFVGGGGTCESRRVGKDGSVEKGPELPTGADQSQAIALSPDEKVLLIGAEDGRLLRGDAANGAILSRAPRAGHEGSITDLAIGSGRLFSVSEDCTIRAWDMSTAVPSPTTIGEGEQAHQHAVRGVAVSPDGKSLLTGGNDQTCRIWSIGSEVEYRGFLQDPVARSNYGPVAFFDSKYLLGRLDGEVEVVDPLKPLPLGARPVLLGTHLKGDHLNSVAITAHGWIFTTSDKGRAEEVDYRSSRSRQIVGEWCRVAANDTLVAIGSLHGALAFFRPDDMRHVLHPLDLDAQDQGLEVSALAVAPWSSFVLAASRSGGISLIDASDIAHPRVIDRIDLAPSYDHAMRVVFSPDQEHPAFFAGTARGVLLRFELDLVKK